MPRNSLWINFISLAFTNDKVCLTNDYYTINLNDPGKFLIKADNVEEQHCYFNIKTNGRLYNTFISKGIRNSASKIDYTRFQIEHALGKSKTTETYNTTAELKELLENGTSAAGSEAEVNRNYYSNAESRYKGVGRKLDLIREGTKPEKNQQDQDFFLYDGAYAKKKKKRKYKKHGALEKSYDNLRIKAQHFLMNHAYSRLNNNDYLINLFYK